MKTTRTSRAALALAALFFLVSAAYYARQRIRASAPTHSPQDQRASSSQERTWSPGEAWGPGSVHPNPKGVIR